LWYNLVKLLWVLFAKIQLGPRTRYCVHISFFYFLWKRQALFVATRAVVSNMMLERYVMNTLRDGWKLLQFEWRYSEMTRVLTQILIIQGWANLNLKWFSFFLLINKLARIHCDMSFVLEYTCQIRFAYVLEYTCQIQFATFITIDQIFLKVNFTLID